MNPIFPIIAIGVAWLFSAQLAKQWWDRRRAHALAWAGALFLFGLGHVCVLIGITAGWTPPVFGTYWLSGALLNVPLLAIGQLHLLDDRRSVIWWTLAGLAVVWNTAFTIGAEYDTAVLAASTTVPSGESVIGGSIAYGLLRPMTYTFAIVVIGSAWSAWTYKKWSLLLIALGTTVAAAGSSVIGSTVDYLFPILSASGVLLMYAGFRAVSVPKSAPATDVVPTNA
ncbi:hypothetical protein [Euzebya tangerina]|uniref:hypothetical protein n=1 Tax=Euzebya tangerina TaxID=591198 RepID=UPI0013C347B4|nr:hypothetical protein [Euzebya tangerina]